MTILSSMLAILIQVQIHLMPPWLPLGPYVLRFTNFCTCKCSPGCSLGLTWFAPCLTPHVVAVVQLKCSLLALDYDVKLLFDKWISRCIQKQGNISEPHPKKTINYNTTALLGELHIDYWQNLKCNLKALYGVLEIKILYLPSMIFKQMCHNFYFQGQEQCI